MYKVNLQTNRIEALATASFSELGLRERDHLQEWLAHTPQALGEDLLVIQKEFAGFDDTRERLDLLALDKDGRMVVIENKLDDSGRDVVWQALKYASYCSSLKKEQIVEIFQAHLHKYQTPGVLADAKQVLREFFDGKDWEEIKLNPGNEQRLILVAANFRKEVTSTALWLLGYRIRLQCFKVTPYQGDGQQLYLNVDQIIPPPEAADYMIGIANKEVAEQSDEGEVKLRHKLRIEFWTQALDALHKSPCRMFDNVNPSSRHKSSTGSGVSAIWYELVFGYNEARVQIYCDKRDETSNKFIFDHLKNQEESIQEKFGDEELIWNRMEGLKGAQVQCVKEFDGQDKDNWPAMTAWMVDRITKLELATRDSIAAAGRLLAAQKGSA